MTEEPQGIFSPLDDVVAEAERRAEAEHRRLTEPCPHEFVVHAADRLDVLCLGCHEWVVEP